jgi:hypothetical protein
LLCCLWSLKQFCSPSPSTSKATKISQINEGMNKICLYKWRGLWACGWHIWTVYVLEPKIFERHFIVFALPKGFLVFHTFLNCSKWTINKDNIRLKIKGSKFIYFPWTSSSSSCLFIVVVLFFGISRNIVNLHFAHPWSWKSF